MNTSNRKHSLPKPAALAALAVAASAFFCATAFAYNAPIGAGEGMDPSQQVQMKNEPVVAATAPATATDPTYTYTPASTVGPLSRDEVREALSNWRAAGILVPANEIGDTNETVAARQAFNEMQAEVITARWAAESLVMAKAREAEYAAQLAREEIEAVLAAASREQPVDTAVMNSNVTGGMPPEVAQPTTGTTQESLPVRQ